MLDTEVKTNLEAMYARMLALQIGVHAILNQLPNDHGFASFLEEEIERVRSILLAHPIGDESLAAFESQIQGIRRAAMASPHSTQ
jgi:hypothetical protein